MSANPFRRLGLRPAHAAATAISRTCCMSNTPDRCSAASRWWSASTTSAILEHPQYFTRVPLHAASPDGQADRQAAARVLTPSEFSREAILRHYQIDERKVVVVPNAVSSCSGRWSAQVAAADRGTKIRNPRAVRPHGGRFAAPQESPGPAARFRETDPSAPATAASSGIRGQRNLVLEGAASRR